VIDANKKRGVDEYASAINTVRRYLKEQFETVNPKKIAPHGKKCQYLQYFI
jgi:hypothetical protein